MTFSSIRRDPRPDRSARIVSADRCPPERESPVRMEWLCECGHYGTDVPGLAGWCPSCKSRIRVPEEPMKASREDVLAALERGCATCNGCTPKGFKCRTCGAEA